MRKLLDLLDPTSWAFRIVGALGVVALLWFGVIDPYNKYVSAKAVVAALVKERADVKPKIDGLESQIKTLKQSVADREKIIVDMSSAAELEKSKQLKAANEKTIQYNAVVKQNKELFARFNAAMLSKSELADRLRDITEQSSSSSANTSDSGFTRRLGAAYAQCESDVSGLLETASSTNERAAKAEAGLRALKN